GDDHCLKQLAIFIYIDAARKTVGRDPVTAFGKDRHAVNHKGKALTGLVALLLEFQGAQARALCCLIYRLAIYQQSCLEGIERMSAQSVVPPKRWMRNNEVERNAIGAGRQVHLAPCGYALVR